MPLSKAIEWLISRTRTGPHGAALVLPGETLDYTGLRDRAARISRALSRDGLVPGAPLGILTRQASRGLFGCLAGWYAGCPVFPLPPDQTEAQLRTLLRDAGVSQVLADSPRPLPPGTRWLSTEWLDGPLAGTGASPVAPIAGAPALYIATSGTTGNPRAVSLTWDNLEAAARAAAARIPLAPGDTWLHCLPPWHIGGASILLRCLHGGARVVLHEGFNACRVGEDLARREVSHLSLVPAMLARLLNSARPRPPAVLRHALVGGGPLSATLARQALDSGWPLCISYGLTEAASQVATLCSIPADWEQGDVGHPLPGIHVSVVDDSGAPVTGTGWIRISGPTLTPSAGESFTTGDRGYVDRNGHLHVLGRGDDLLVSGGRNIHPMEVEEGLAACRGVREVAVTGVSDPVWGQRLVALVVGDADESELDAWSREHLPSWLRPRAFKRVGQLPRNAMGKLERHRLRDLLGNQ